MLAAGIVALVTLVLAVVILAARSEGGLKLIILGVLFAAPVLLIQGCLCRAVLG